MRKDISITKWREEAKNLLPSEAKVLEAVISLCGPGNHVTPIPLSVLKDWTGLHQPHVSNAISSLTDKDLIRPLDHRGRVLLTAADRLRFGREYHKPLSYRLGRRICNGR